MLDESGTHDAGHCLIAGYLGASGQWNKFNNAWGQLLEQHGVHPPLHANKLWPHAEQFENWTDERVAKLLIALFVPVQQFRLNPIAASIDTPAFNALTFGERSLLALHTPKHLRRIRLEQPQPYHLAFSSVLSAASHRVRHGTTIDVVLARHQQYGGQAEQNFALFKDAWAPDGVTLGEIRQAEPRDEAGLQIADLLAYMIFKAEEAGGLAQLILPEQRIFAALAKGAHDILTADAESLDRMLDEHGQTTRAWFRDNGGTWADLQAAARASSTPAR